MSLTETKSIEAKVWAREPNEHYVEPHWCSERLFAEEQFSGLVWDPCCGFGRIPDAANRAGHQVIATDIVNRGYRGLHITRDFLTFQHALAPNIVANPPFNIVHGFIEKALSFPDVRKVAMVFPTPRLNAAKWLMSMPLARIWLMTPRPSMPPGHTIAAGEKPGGGKMDFSWLVFDRDYAAAAPETRWLRRDT